MATNRTSLTHTRTLLLHTHTQAHTGLNGASRRGGRCVPISIGEGWSVCDREHYGKKWLGRWREGGRERRRNRLGSGEGKQRTAQHRDAGRPWTESNSKIMLTCETRATSHASPHTCTTREPGRTEGQVCWRWRGVGAREGGREGGWSGEEGE